MLFENDISKIVRKKEDKFIWIFIWIFGVMISFWRVYYSNDGVIEEFLMY